MPNIAVFHPQIVHFIVVLGFVGVALRVLTLFLRVEWIRPAATLALLAAAVAAVLAVKSGVEAHGPAERVPGARPAVEEHEELGEKTRNLFVVVGILELAALALRKREKARRVTLAGSAVVGLVAAYFLYEAAEHGGEVVYSYAGGVGTRSGEPEDVKRLLVAGLFHGARAEREAGDTAAAGRLVAELARQLPNDFSVQVLAARSLLVDQHDPAAATAALNAIPVAPDDPRAALMTGLLRADIQVAQGQADSARATIEQLRRAFPDNPMVERLTGDALAKLP